MRVLLVVEYSGSNYSGWQCQPGMTTVQGVLDNAIEIVASHAINSFCSGRTDKGVHAYQQFVHFDTTAIRTENSWLLGINSNLPRDIRVKLVKFVSDDFHARHSAIARTYHYYIDNSKVSSAIFHGRLLWVPMHLDITKMNEAARYLVGKHDFSSFRSSNCQAKSPIKTVYSLDVIQLQGNIIVVKIKANSFLYNMVRNILGLLVGVGSGRYKVLNVPEVLAEKNRDNKIVKVAPDGLYFMMSHYKEDIFLDSINEKYLF